MPSLQRFFRLLALGLPVLVSLEVPGAFALDSDEAKCRKSLAGGVALLSSTLAWEQAKCHEGRLRGTVSDATDCNDPAQLPEKARTKLSRAEAKILKFAQTRCASKGIAPASIGLHSCPAPCGDTPLSSFDGVGGVADCLTCRTRATTSGATTSLLGSPLPPSDATRCLKAVSLALSGQISARAKAGQKCRYLADLGRRAEPETGCANATTDPKVIAAGIRADKKVNAACSPTELAELDVCSGLGTTAEVLPCIETLAADAADQLFAAAYDPPPTRSATIGPQDYSHWYWPINHRPTETWPVIETEMHFLTGYYGFALDEASGQIAHFGGLYDGMSATGAQHRPATDVEAMPAADLRLEAGSAGSGILATSFLGSNDSTIDRARMIDGGRHMNRIEIPTLGYAADAGLEGRLEVAAMPRHVVFSHTVSGASAAADTARIVLGGAFVDGFTPQWLESGRALQLLDGQGRGWLFIVYRSDELLSLSPAGEVVAERQVANPPASGVTVSLLVLAAHSVSGDEIDLYLDPDATVEVSYTPLDLAGDPAGSVVDAAWDPGLGAFLVPLATLQATGAPNSADFENPVYHHWHGRHRIEVDTGRDAPMSVPLALHGSDRLSWYITGGVALFRDEAGRPNGVPVQISKNWHGEYWYHLYAHPRFAGRGPEVMELTMASSKWGDAHAASHAQLSLIGWGDWGGHWDESAVGVFGENITYDPDMTLRRAMMDDVRPVLVQSEAKWNWKGNVGGADFLGYATAAQPYWKRRLARVRSTYDAPGPLLTDVTYSALSSDGRIEADVRTHLSAADDLVRAHYRLDYRFLEDVSYDRLSFFQVAADNYSDNDFRQYAWGNASGMVEDRTTDAHGATGYASDTDRGIPLEGESPWLMLYDNQRTGDSLPERFANVGVIVREFKAEIGETTLTTPHINLRRTNNGGFSQYGFELGLPHESGSPWCGESCGGETRFVPAGSRVQMTIEYVVPPADASRYYGESDYLLAMDPADYQSTNMMITLASGGAMEIEPHVGTLLRSPPIEMETVLGEVAAELSVSGGLGYVALLFRGLERYDGWRLERRDGDTWVTVDQSVHGNDFAQVDLDADAGTWTVIVSVPMRGGGHFRLLRTTAP